MEMRKKQMIIRTNTRMDWSRRRKWKNTKRRRRQQQREKKKTKRTMDMRKKL